MSNRIIALVLAAAAGLAASGAQATTSTANMNVSIQITAGCNISVSNINFGAMPSTSLTTAQTSTSAMGGLFTYTCSPGSNTPALTAGQGSNYSGGNRMKGGTSGNFLPYALNLPSIATFTGVAQTAQITATIPAQTTLPTVDTYTDTVVLTLTY
jgi:spore coat protein U-like protein